jgi:hypothetical protein
MIGFRKKSLLEWRRQLAVKGMISVAALAARGAFAKAEFSDYVAMNEHLPRIGL